MVDKYKGYSLTRLYTEIGDREKVIDIHLQLYLEMHSEANEVELRAEFKRDLEASRKHFDSIFSADDE